MGIDQQFWQVTKEQIGCESHSQLTVPKEATPKYLLSILGQLAVGHYREILTEVVVFAKVQGLVKSESQRT